MDYPTLFPDDPTIQERFEEFHAAHPDVYSQFKRFALQLLAAGRKRGSAEQIIQRIRWETAINPTRDDGFKINDHFRSRYARKLAGEDERFKEFFEFRQLRAA